jgi:hypothetical protein
VTADKLRNPRQVELDEIHRLRGAFLSHMADVENRLDSLICLFFQVPADRRHSFAAWILAGMALADKIDVVGKVTRSGQPGSTMKPMISTLRELRNARNDISHAGVSLDMTAPSRPMEEWHWTSVRQTRRGSRQEMLTVEGLELLVQRASTTAAHLVAVMNEMAMAPDRLVSLTTDWVVTYEKLTENEGIPTPCDELAQFLFETFNTVQVEPEEALPYFDG